MNFNEIKELCVNSASIYYDYCKNKSGAIAVIPIKKVEHKNSYYLLTLAKDMNYGADKERYNLRINGNLLNINDYDFLEYDDDNRELLVSFGIKFDFPITIKNIQIESNLLFLVENVKRWYEEPKYSISKVTTLPDIPFFPACEKYTPSEEQFSAVNNIKSHALSYVWGAPGTGKTQFVLARCIADYIQKFLKNSSKRKIIVTAPTNNALEQILFGVFKVLEAENISTDLVIRLGLPSKKFASQYPNSCECFAAEKSLKRIENKINLLKSIPEKRAEIIKLTNLKSAITEFSDELHELREAKIELDNRISKIEEDIDDIQLELSKNRVESFEAKETLNVAEKEAKKFLNRIIKSKKELFQYKLDVLNIKIHTLYDVENNLNVELDKLNTELEENKNQLSKLKKPNDIRNEFLSLIKSTFSNTSCLQTLSKFMTENMNNTINNVLKLAYIKCDELIEYNTETLNLSRYGKMNDDEINSKIEELTAKYNEQKGTGKKSQIETANVIALTVDRFIFDYNFLSELKNNDEYDIEHIFIDEAAYLCLIKGLILLSFKRPITLLGDHMQLPPVFECPKTLLEDNPCLALWDIPIIYFEELFKNDINTLLRKHKNNISPIFNELSKANLNTTFRFGSKLANILAGTVYSDKFHSANDENPTCITIINAVKVPTETKRVSPLEIRAICEYINHHSNTLNNFSVLTPYRNQLFELQNALPSTTECMTVHASQGQEWDTVILSTVDTFMARDVRVINTAVSRAKKHLVVVCDANEWNMHPKHLISKIISQSNKTIDYKSINSYKN